MKIKSKEIAVEFTNRCSARCQICPREQFTQRLQDMDWDLYKKVIDDAASYDIDMLNTCGYGETFLDKLMFARLRYARKKLPDARIYVSSTCFQMDESKYREVAEYVDILKISFYGMSRQTYEASHRGNLKYNVSLHNILGFLEYIAHSPKKPYVSILLTVTETNQGDVKTFIDYWTPLVDEVMVWKPHNFAGGRRYRQIDRANQKSCGRPFNGPPIITASGKVSICCFDFNSQLIIGDMKTQTLEEVFHSEALRKIQQAHRDNDFRGLICQDCCQTNHDPGVLVYASNAARAVGKENSTLLDFKEGVTV